MYNSHEVVIMKLKELRKSKKLKQKDIAEKLGISQPAYGNYERGVRQPDIQTLKKLSKIFDVPINYLIDDLQDDLQLEGDYFQHNRLQALRTQSEKSLDDIVNETGINIADLLLYEINKKQPGVSELKTLAAYFNVSIPYLLGQSEVRNPLQDLNMRSDVAYVMTKGCGYTNLIEVDEEERKVVEEVLAAIRKKNG